MVSVWDIKKALERYCSCTVCVSSHADVCKCLYVHVCEWCRPCRVGESAVGQWGIPVLSSSERLGARCREGVGLFEGVGGLSVTLDDVSNFCCLQASCLLSLPEHLVDEAARFRPFVRVQLSGEVRGKPRPSPFFKINEQTRQFLFTFMQFQWKCHHDVGLLFYLSHAFFLHLFVLCLIFFTPGWNYTHKKKVSNKNKPQRDPSTKGLLVVSKSWAECAVLLSVTWAMVWLYVYFNVDLRSRKWKTVTLMMLMNLRLRTEFQKTMSKLQNKCILLIQTCKNKKFQFNFFCTQTFTQKVFLFTVWIWC